MSTQLEAPPQTSGPLHTCFALEQIFVNLDGSIRACCMADRVLAPSVNEAGAALFQKKIRINERIVEANDSSGCWKACSVRYRTEVRPATNRITKIVVYTNTFCPLMCQYCSLAHTQDSPAWSEETRPQGVEGNVWNSKNQQGEFLPPVRVHTNNTPGLLETLKRLVGGLEQTRDLWIEFTGGDSAYHPEFVDALDYLGSKNIRVSYLSSGVVPPKLVPDLVRHVATGNLYITASPDAVLAETWAAIKRRPERLFYQVVDFFRAVSAAQVANQITVKFIVTPANAPEAPVFLQFYASLGVRKFALSEYRAQPTYFIEPPAEDLIAAVCAETWRLFTEADLPADSELILIGLERHFGEKTWFRRDEVVNRAATAFTKTGNS